MKKLKLFLGIIIGIGILGFYPLLQSGTAALPSGLYETVKSSLGGIEWTPTTLKGRDFGDQQKLTASDGVINDSFGFSVAVDGDTALIGAFGDSIGANTFQGSAYVFVNNAGNWEQQTKLTINEGEGLDLFGYSVALDGNTALVGVVYDDIEANADQGSAYVFVREGNIWTQQTQLIADDGEAEDQFGFSVAIDGDTAVIGASGDDIDAIEDHGSAYVFVRSGTEWTQQAKLLVKDGEFSDSFGNAVTVEGDTALIGAYTRRIDENIFQGSAYVFVRSGTSWTQQAQLTADDGAASDVFGWSVALSGNTALIGAMNDDIGSSSDQGSVYVFVRSGDSWTQQTQLTASDGGENDLFGYSVALEGDTALVGAMQDDIDTNNFQGSVYVFKRSGTFWVQQTQLIASDGAAIDNFGASVALSGSKAVIGANRAKIGSNVNQGAVYVFTDPELIPTTTPDGPTATPTPSPTPTLEPGTTELIVNGGFETLGGDGKPDVTPWIIKNSSGDKASCNKDKDGDGIPDKIVAFAGNCAFQFKDVVGEAGKIEQVLDLSAIIPAVGDTLNLSFFAQSKASATVKAKVVFKYGDDTKTKISVESSGLEAYTEFTGSGTLTSTDSVKSKISFKSNQTTGKVFVDEVSLQHIVGASGLIAVPDARLNNRNQ